MPQLELYNKIFTDNIGNNNPKELLQNIAAEYPYFSLVHFFLLKETAPGDFNYRKIASKTALHFNNPFLLKYQLYKKLPQVSEVEKTEITAVVEKAATIEDASKVDSFAEIPTVPVMQEIPEAEMVFGVEKADEEMDMVHEISKSPAAAEIQESDKVDFAKKPGVVEEVENVVKAGATIDNDDKKEELLFEPLHTTDYFASQGIKLSEEVQAGDKLGKQLRSFTDWLKTMKKAGHGKLPAGNPTIDLAVQNLAEKSNKEQEVLTESMADVYIKQGKAGKAHEIYKKLSLLNPAKSAYFAAKIELLKEN